MAKFHIPAGIDLERRIRRIWSHHRSQEVLLSPSVLDARILEQQCCMEIGTVSKEHVLTALESSVAREVHGHRRCQPDDFNGCGYFYVRLYCTGLGFQANIVEEYGLLSALQHIFAGLKRTRDQKLSSGLMSGHLNLAIAGFMLLTFMITQPFQLHFADTEQYFLRHPGLVLLTFITTHLSQFGFADAEQYWLITLTFFRNQ